MIQQHSIIIIISNDQIFSRRLKSDCDNLPPKMSGTRSHTNDAVPYFNVLTKDIKPRSIQNVSLALIHFTKAFKSEGCRFYFLNLHKFVNLEEFQGCSCFVPERPSGGLGRGRLPLPIVREAPLLSPGPHFTWQTLEKVTPFVTFQEGTVVCSSKLTMLVTVCVFIYLCV